MPAVRSMENPSPNTAAPARLDPNAVMPNANGNAQDSGALIRIASQHAKLIAYNVAPVTERANSGASHRPSRNAAIAPGSQAFSRINPPTLVTA